MVRLHTDSILLAIRGRAMARNTLLNLAGQLSPVLGALIAVPLLINGLGVERFGVLAIIWLVVGYFSFFDLGMGNATARLVAERLGAQREDEVPPIIQAALLLMGVMGCVGAVVLLVAAPRLTTSLLNIPIPLRDETLGSIRLLAAAIPMVILTSCFRGVLEAYQRFDLVNSVRIPFGLLTYFLPLLVMQHTRHLGRITIALVVLRLVTLVIYAVQYRRIVPPSSGSYRLQDHFRPLLTYGGWVTVSTLIAPLLVYCDRFVIGSRLSVAAVAYYAIPFEITTKLWVLPGAFTGVLFPLFAVTVRRDPQLTALLLSRGNAFLLFVLLPATVTGIVMAREGLGVWIGTGFADNSYRVFQILLMGVFVNCFAQITSTLIQGAGRADITAKAHLAELPLYLLALWLLITSYGLIGAACAWLLRILLDTAILFRCTVKFVPDSADVLKNTAFALLATLTAALLLDRLSSPGMKIAGIAAVLVLIGTGAWVRLVRQDDKASLYGTLAGIARMSGIKRGVDP